MKQSIRRSGLYQLGYKIGVVHEQGDQYIFTTIDGNGVYSEVVPYLPPYVGKSWADVANYMRIHITITQETVLREVQDFADYLDEYVEEHYQRYTKRFPKWVWYSDRYDEVVIDWTEADPFSIVAILNDYLIITPMKSLANFENTCYAISTLDDVKVSVDLFNRIVKACDRSPIDYKDVAYVKALIHIAHTAVNLLCQPEKSL